MRQRAKRPNKHMSERQFTVSARTDKAVVVVSGKCRQRIIILLRPYLLYEVKPLSSSMNLRNVRLSQGPGVHKCSYRREYYYINMYSYAIVASNYLVGVVIALFSFFLSLFI